MAKVKGKDSEEIIGELMGSDGGRGRAVLMQVRALHAAKARAIRARIARAKPGAEAQPGLDAVAEGRENLVEAIDRRLERGRGKGQPPPKAAPREQGGHGED